MTEGPTIRDVASMAGVSIATVSNILNNRVAVKSDKVKRVHDAIEALGYRPDIAARSLKTHRTNTIGIVLPNIVEQLYAQLYHGSERVLGQWQYQASLYTTSDLPDKENHILRTAEQQRVDGLILVTCQPQAVGAFAQLEEKGIKIVFAKREPADRDSSFIEFDNAKSVAEAVERLARQGMRSLLLLTGPLEHSDDALCHAAFLAAIEASGGVRGETLEANTGKEGAFQSMAVRFSRGDAPDAVIVTSSAMLDGAMRAVELVDSATARRIRFVVMAEHSWADRRMEQVAKFGQDAIIMGETAAEMLLKRLNNPTAHEKAYKRLQNAAPSRLVRPAEGGTAMRPTRLRVLMFDSPACSATRLLLANFEEQHGLRVDIEAIDSKRLYQSISDGGTRERYDIFQIDQPWLAEFSREGWLAGLDGALAESPEALRHFEPGVLNAYTYVDGRAFALPYKFGTQLLFYRRDLFENAAIRAAYREANGAELRPPKTWEEFNCVAKFFSRAHNPDSPVLYGTTLGARAPIAACCEYLPRLWAYGGEVMDAGGRFALTSREAVRALENYRDCFAYAQPDALNSWWDEEAECFARGEAAMMILFVAHAGVITDRNRSRVVGCVGYEQLPGGAPLLGGWSLAIQARSPNFTEAFAFLRWAASQDLAIPQTLLGGTTASLVLFKSSELVPLYPWLPKVLDSFSRSRRREVNKFTTGSRISELRFEEILGRAVHLAVKGEMAPDEALRDAMKVVASLMR